MNVYDFDKTIFYPDSSATFLKWEARRHPAYLAVWIPAILWRGLLLELGTISKTRFKESLFLVLRRVPDVDSDVRIFWDEHENMICPWYLAQKKDSDLIISASPEFLIAPIAKRLGIPFISTRMDKRTGRIIGENCFGEEKVRRFYKEYPGARIDSFYSDSRSDLPLAKIAERAFLVEQKGQKPVPWHE